MPDLYLDLSSGVSGDMFAAALIDAGADASLLREVLNSLNLPGFTLELSKVNKASLAMCDFKVRLEHDNHDSDMAHLFGPHPHHHETHPPEPHGHHEPPHGLHPCPEHERLMPWQQADLLPLQEPGPHGSHHHGPEHEHPKPHAPHEHRGLNDILPIIDRSSAQPEAKELAKKIFRIIAEAEAKAHGCPLEEVHFHEVGALDSIVDILSAAVLYTSLHIKTCFATPLAEGHGQINCQHGLLPIPVPAVCNIAEAHGLPMVRTEVFGELVTPTGAAIIAALEPEFAPPPPMRILKTGYGAGKRAYERPSFVRAQLFEPLPPAPHPSPLPHAEHEGPEGHPLPPDLRGNDEIVKIECNIDDCSGELMSALMEKLFVLGACDVSFTPLFMKKNRPAFELNVMVKPHKLRQAAALIMRESTAIGIRYSVMQRLIMDRHEEMFDSSLGPVEVKRCVLPPELGDYSTVYPEYESVKEAAQRHRISVKEADAVIRGELLRERR